MYNSLTKLAHSLSDQTKGSHKQSERVLSNLETLARYPFVSGLVLDGHVALQKLKSEPSKFRQTCRVIERKNQDEARSREHYDSRKRHHRSEDTSKHKEKSTTASSVRQSEQVTCPSDEGDADSGFGEGDGCFSDKESFANDPDGDAAIVSSKWREDESKNEHQQSGPQT